MLRSSAWLKQTHHTFFSFLLVASTAASSSSYSPSVHNKTSIHQGTTYNHNRFYSTMSKPIVLPPSQKHVGTVIFIHGLGDSGAGWADGASMIQQLNPHIKFVLPNAPVRKITLNYGMAMPGWYDIASLDERGTDDVAGLEQSRASITELIEEEHNSGIPYSNIIVGGFSQGAVVSLYTVFQHKQPLGGCVSLSGYVPVAARYATLIHPENKATPIFMRHGDQDPLINIAFGQKSMKLLAEAGLAVDWAVEKGMGHSATPSELLDVAKFIKKRIPPA
eukprot:TRINITY_DN9921_c0_g1_i1.p1 TRINITY_DN9921_c0_g1~~TRINITY_DN9921_c0_g1_i1.p1  ORF type:complete len:277 (+),score=67.81 TRINITY_DN9921_c0_g1_i1:17-847(+)